MRQIDTLIFDYGGVLVNIDDGQVVRALYFDDRKDNFEAGRNFGFKSVLVRTDHIEESREWNELLEEIVLKNGTDIHSDTIQ